MRKALTVLSIAMFVVTGLLIDKSGAQQSSQATRPGQRVQAYRQRSGPYRVATNMWASHGVLAVLDRIEIVAAPGVQWLRLAGHTGFGGNKPETWNNIFFDDVPLAPMQIIAPKSPLPPPQERDWQFLHYFTMYAWGDGYVEFYMVELVADPPYAIEGQFIPPGQDTITINPPSAQAGNTVT
ncbi:MAG: hypothetical protein AB1631_34780, partial [Acidobacteriota bacterium]